MARMVEKVQVQMKVKVEGMLMLMLMLKVAGIGFDKHRKGGKARPIYRDIVQHELNTAGRRPNILICLWAQSHWAKGAHACACPCLTGKRQGKASAGGKML